MEHSSLKPGSNKIKLLTNPYRMKCHFHLKQLNKLISDVTNDDHDVYCEYCIVNNNDQLMLIPTKYFVLGAKLLEDNKDVLLILSSNQCRRLQDFVRIPEYGDPRKHDIDFYMGLRPDDHKIKILKTYDTIEKFEEIEKKCQELCKLHTMKDCIAAKDRQAVKKFYLQCKNYSDDLFKKMISTVENDFPQYVEMLKTILVFS